MKRPDPLGLSGPSDDSSAIARAVRLRGAGDFTGAIAAFREASLDSHPLVRAIALWQIGAIFLEEFADPKAAITPLRDAWELRHPDVAPLVGIDLGIAYEAVGELSRAREVYEWVWELNDPRYSPYAAVNLGGVLHAAGETESARGMLREAVAGGNESAAALAHKGLGVLEDAAGNLEAAQAEYELALQMGVDHAPELRVALAHIQGKLGLDQAARKNYEDALAEGVDHRASVRYVLASLQFRAGAWSEALKNYQLVWEAADDEFEPGRTDLRASAAGVLAQLYKKAGDLQPAKRAAQYAVDKGSDRVAARAMYFLAALDAADGKDDAARKTFEQALKRAGGNFDLPEARLGLARLDERQGDLEAALRGYEQFMASDDPSLRSSVTFAKGRVLEKLGDRAGARAAYQAALKGSLSPGLRETVIRRLAALDNESGSTETTEHPGKNELIGDRDDVAGSNG